MLQVRRSLTKDQDWDELAMQAASGVFSIYDDSNDPDVNSVATLFVDGDLEGWGGGTVDSASTRIPTASDIEGHQKNGGGAEAEPAHAAPVNT